MTDANIADLSHVRRATSLRVDVFVLATIFFLAGLAVTFTQTLHEFLNFNSWLVAVFGLVYGLALIVLALPALGGTRSSRTLIVAFVSVAMGIVAPLMPSTAGLAVLLLIWASVMTLASVWSWVQTRDRDALTIGFFALLLSVILAFGARDLPTVMGFFAGFCIIIGVYLGIASFDRTARATESIVV